MATKPKAKSHLSDLLDRLGKSRIQTAKAYERYKKLQEGEQALRGALYDELQSVGLRSAKGSDFMATIAEKPTIVVKHEPSVIEWLQSTPDIESDVYIGLKPTQFQTLAKQVLKQTGEVIPGTELEVRESLSIRAANKKG